MHITTRITYYSNSGGAVSDHETIIHRGYYTYLTSTALGRQRQVLKTQDSVALLVHVTDLDTVVLVQQPREAMVRPDNPDGMVQECIAGRFDKQTTVRELAASEAKEEAGITVDPNDIIILNDGRPVALSAGAMTERSYLCFARITSAQLSTDQKMFSAPGEDECIRRIMLPVESLDRCSWDDVRVMLLVTYLQRQLDSERR